MRIFISYAHDDSARLVDIQRALDIHEVWIDHRLSVGQEWWNEIEHQIAACNCFMLLVSSRAMASEYCQKEFETAVKLGKPVAPVMVEPMEIPAKLGKYQVINLVDGVTPENTIKMLNGLFEIERQVFNPLRPPKGHPVNPHAVKLSISDLYFATTNTNKKRMYEQILNVELQTSPVSINDIQHIDPGEVAMDKAVKAFEIFKKPVFVDHSALCIRAWGGLPGGLTTTFMVPLGLHNICKMLQPFEDKYAEAISVIAFTDGNLRRKFVGALPGEIADYPRGNGYSWNNIFIPTGFSTTFGEMTEDQVLSISSRRRAVVEFMQFLQSNYDFS
jgi:non-canonical purine NTP pyrophosphatase (RdgB/HAM1 family)